MKTKRDEIQESISDEFIDKGFKGIIYAAPRVGKIKITINCLNTKDRILIAYPETNIKQSWIEDFKKWKFKGKKIKYSTYHSFKKLRDPCEVLVLDECFEGNTEILTDKGFKKFKDLDKTELVAQWENGIISFVKPLEYIKRIHDGQLCKIHLKRDCFLYTTPNHNHPMINRRSGKVEYKKMNDWKFNGNWNIVSSGKSDIIDTEELSYLERLYIILQADGSIHSELDNSHTTCAFSFSKQRKIDRFLDIVNNSNLIWREVKGHSIIGNKAAMRRFMVEMPFKSSKILRNHINTTVSFEKAKAIIEEMVHWDGHIIKNSKDYYYYSSINEDNVNFYNEIAILANYICYKSVQIDDRKTTFNNVHRLYISLDNKRTPNGQRINKTLIDFNDYVYCVSVPSGNIVIRSEGVTLVSGNCHLISDAQMLAIKKYIDNLGIKKVIALTGTLAEDTEKKLLEVLKLKVIVKYSIEDAIRDGVITDYVIDVITTPLSTINDIKVVWKKGEFMTSEKKSFDYLSSKILSTASNSTKIKLLRLTRMRMIMKSKAKIELTKKVLKQLNDKRVLVFCGLQDVSDNLGINSYHSKNKDEKVKDDFINGVSNKLAVCKQLNTGITFKSLDTAIINYFNSNSEDLAQKISRTTCKELFNENKIAHIIIISSNEEVELKWLSKALTFFSPDKINYINL